MIIDEFRLKRNLDRCVSTSINGKTIIISTDRETEETSSEEILTSETKIKRGRKKLPPLKLPGTLIITKLYYLTVKSRKDPHRYQQKKVKRVFVSLPALISVTTNTM